MNAPLLKFRVHFSDGSILEVEAVTPTAARVVAMRQAAGRIIAKVKVVRAS
jgi:hypothetical protein